MEAVRTLKVRRGGLVRVDGDVLRVQNFVQDHRGQVEAYWCENTKGEEFYIFKSDVQEVVEE